MDSKLAILFQFLYFIRPQDWIAGLSGARLAGLTLLGLIITTAMRRDGLTLKDLFRTPVDVAVLLFFGWVLYASKDTSETFKEIRPYFLYYILTCLALTTLPRLQNYMKWWLWCLLILTGMGILTVFGMDITNASEIITMMQGRLSLGTYQHNNPNALGHTVIVAIPLLYFWFIWRRPAERQWIGFALMVPVIYVVYLTQSKGAYISGFITVVTALLFGRSKFFKIIAIGLAVTLGSTALSQLPRMQQLSRKEQGVQGRLMAWDVARMTMEMEPKGVGWSKFKAVIYWDRQYSEKATHSSYVQIGASLGKGGLFFYMGLVWCTLRVVLMTKTRTDEELRMQGMLYSLLVPFCISNWMIDRAYHVEFFIMLAAVSAFHRIVGLRVESKDLAADEEEAARTRPRPYNLDPGVPAVPVAAYALPAMGPEIQEVNSRWQLGTETEGRWNRGGPWQPPEEVTNEEGEEKKPSKPWSRLGLIDLAGTYLLYRLVVEAWVYIIKNF